jgi:hypothetical protein
MKIFAIVIAIACTSSLAVAAPDKMSAEDAARLDAAVAHEALVMQAAQAQAAPYEKTIDELCRKYKIERADLGKSVGVDVESGLIKRAPKAAAVKLDAKQASSAKPGAVQPVRSEEKAPAASEPRK